MAHKEIKMSDEDFQKVTQLTDEYIAQMRAIMSVPETKNCGGSLLCNVNAQLISGMARAGMAHMSVGDIAKAHVLGAKAVAAPEAADEIGPAYMMASLVCGGAQVLGGGLDALGDLLSALADDDKGDDEISQTIGNA